ncbi:molybdate transport system permease protein ModB [Thermoanaerobacter kivui]|uniref:Molybdate transport system permease protein ModB n=1 Tax=Thermoanaerobacter kivui TaxID=2325 RepID=A0A097ATK4_THEKI|nr:ABC transporter permease [Thermoanaerobacter kivui]AIS53147.1 molybdate transport system permease protein ModB [Thermoanaerobacter kivui]
MRRNIIEVIFLPMFFILIVYPVATLLGHVSINGIVKTFHDWLFWKSVKNTFVAAFFASILALFLALGFGYYHLFSKNSFIYRLANLMNDLPVAVPHTVAGAALLLAFGRNVLGFISNTGLAFMMISVVLAMFFVSYPLAARAITSGVDQIEPEIVDVARTLGDTPFKVYLRIILPLLKEAIFSGLVLTFARSLSEFAAVIMFGGNIPGVTQVLASYVFTKIEEGELDMAVTASAFCVVMSLIIVGLLNLINKRSIKDA